MPGKTSALPRVTLICNGSSELREDCEVSATDVKRRAGHADAGVLLVLSLVALRYVDETALGARSKWFVRLAIPSSAILMPSAFFLSVLRADATEPNRLIALAYVGAVVLAAGVVLLGIGLLRWPTGR
jgi:hypothetical protein